MTVQITPKSTQHTGMATSTEGSVAAWQVTFELDEDESLHAAISISLAGPPTHHEAQQKALKVLQVFLNDACEAAKKYQFLNIQRNSKAESLLSSCAFGPLKCPSEFSRWRVLPSTSF
jgi:hypothetical protein